MKSANKSVKVNVNRNRYSAPSSLHPSSSGIPRYQPSSAIVSPEWTFPTSSSDKQPRVYNDSEEQTTIDEHIERSRGVSTYPNSNKNGRVVQSTDSKSDFRTIASLSSHAAGASVATPIASNCNPASSFATPKPTKKTSNLLAANNNKRAPIQADKGDEGIQTKSCLSFRLPASSSTTVRGEIPKGTGGESRHPLRSSGVRITSTGGTLNKHESNKMNTLKPNAGRFGWVRRGRVNDSNPGSRAATSQASSSVYPEEDYFDVAGDDIEFPPNASWAEGSLSPTTNLENRSNTRKVTNDKAPSPNKVQITSPMTRQEVKDLFSPPPIKDRGSDRKKTKQYELEKRRRGLYEGEIEPDGVRGQEARVVVQKQKHGATTGSSLPQLSISPTLSMIGQSSEVQNLQQPSVRLRVISSVSTAEGLPASSSLATASSPNSEDYDPRLDFGTTTSSSVDDENAGQKTALHTNIVTPPQLQEKPSTESQKQHHSSSTLPPAHPIPIKNKTKNAISSRGSASFANTLKFHKQQSDVSESTCSDDNIQQMLSDLVPATSYHEQDQGRHPKTDNNNQPRVEQDRTMLNRFASSDSDDDFSDFPTDERSYDDSPYNNDDFHEVQHNAPAKNHQDRLHTGSISSNTTSSLNNAKRKGESGKLGTTGTGVSDTKSSIPASSTKSPSNPMKSFDLTTPHAISGSSVIRQTSDDKQSSTGTSTTGELSSTDSPPNLEVDKLNSLAVEQVNSGQYDEALRLFTRVLQIHQEMHGQNTPHPNTASAYHNLGTVHAKRAQAFEQAATTGASSIESSNEQREQQRQARLAALQCFQAAARLARDSLGKNHPNVAVSLVRIGFLLLQSKQYSNADTTFSEALRIRLEHYGSEHSLVANLYNNLGVCRMHLGEFENGLAALEEALKIQHSIIVKTRNSIIFETGGKLSAQEADQDEAMVIHKLELADTLFNIGGLCLEWIRRDGDNLNDDKQKRSTHAYRAFEEAYNIRLAAYRNNVNHPAVVQVQSLLRTAQQYMIIQNQQQQRNGNSTYHDSRSSQPHELSEASSSFSRNLSATNSFLESPARSMVSSGTQTEKTKLLSEPVGPTASHKSSLYSTPNMKSGTNDSSRRHIDTRIQGYSETSSQEDPSLEGAGSNNLAVSRRIMSTIRKNTYESPSSQKLVKINEEMNTSHDASIFRDTDKTNRDSTNRNESIISASHPPLVEVITRSTDDDDEFGNGGNSSGKNENPSTRIFVAPHSISKTSPSRSKLKRTSPGGGRNSSDDPAYNSISLEADNFSPDISKEESQQTTDDDSFLMHQPLLSGQGLKSWSYDVEENCLIRNTGVDSDRGRIHYPILSNKSSFGSGSVGEYDFGDSNQRDIMIAQPFQAASSKSIQPIRTSVDRNHYAKYLNFEHSSPIKQSSSTSVDSKGRCGSEVSFSTGNKERDEIMNRARTILDLTNIPSTDSDDESEGDANPINAPYDAVGRHSVKQEENSTKFAQTETNSLEYDYLEDGVAPLSDSGRTTAKRSFNHKDIKELLKDPMTCLPEIHDEASRQLKNNNPIDAIHLFETILRCQRRRFGALHPDVASALHNVGIAQLRVQNHDEALKAFEEASRVRKGSLGKDHPLVAVSLVKVGITLLLLKRFEEALWSFREALSVRKNSLGPLHPSTARIYNNIGCVYVEFNEFRQARRAFEAALDTQRSALIHEPNSGPLMFGTATTLCNLGYLYRFRGMHDKAAVVLKEAVELQETVLGKYHSTVLSTLDNLADSCCNSGNGNEALRCYNSVLERFQKSGNSADSKSSSNKLKVLRAESVLHYKMSRVHRIRNDRENQLKSLQLALKAIRSFNEVDGRGDTRNSTAQSEQWGNGEGENPNSTEPNDSLERRVLADIRTCRELLEKEQLKWI